MGFSESWSEKEIDNVQTLLLILKISEIWSLPTGGGAEERGERSIKQRGLYIWCIPSLYFFLPKYIRVEPVALPYVRRLMCCLGVRVYPSSTLQNWPSDSGIMLSLAPVGEEGFRTYNAARWRTARLRVVCLMFWYNAMCWNTKLSGSTRRTIDLAVSPVRRLDSGPLMIGRYVEGACCHTGGRECSLICELNVLRNPSVWHARHSGSWPHATIMIGRSSIKRRSFRAGAALLYITSKDSRARYNGEPMHWESLAAIEHPEQMTNSEKRIDQY